MAKSENFRRLGISIPKDLAKLLSLEVEKQAKTRNVTTSSFIVELLAKHLVK